MSWVIYWIFHPGQSRRMGKRQAEEQAPLPGKKSKPTAESTERLLVDPEKPWFLVKIKESWEVTGPRPGAAAELAEVTKRAAKVYTEQAALYDRQREMTRSDRDWLKTVLASGTTADKCSTFQVQIAEAPLYGGQYVEKLMELARSPKRHESMQAIQALAKVFGTVLPPAGMRKLHYLKQRKWEKAVEQLGEKTLLVVYFEELIKRSFFEFLKLVEILLQDQIAHSREVAMRLLSELAKAHDEQQTNMLGLLANKLGDPERKIASRAMYYLQEVMNAQRNSTDAVVAQVETVLARPGINEKAQYYALTFLSQVMLAHDAPEVTERLVRVYLGILKGAILPSIAREAERAKQEAKKHRFSKNKKNKKGGDSLEVELAPATSRMAKVVATGLNRALPFYKGELNLMAEIGEPVRRLIATGSFATALQALSLLFQVAAADRTGAGLDADFVRTVEGVLEKREALTETSAHPQLLALLYRILCAPELPPRLTERLLRSLLRLVIRLPSVAFTLASLLLLAELLELKPALWTGLRMPADPSAGDEGCLWALHVFAQHYEERVRQLATSILEGAPQSDILAGANPFELCTPLRMLSLK